MNIVLAVTGGIAAYKSPEIIRRLRERGCAVRPVMTDAARAFITPLTLQAVSGHEVPSGLLDPAAEAGMGHIELARWADTVLVAPATADFMARIAHGLADDLPATLCLATTAPIVLAPAMNHRMWKAPATAANRALLAERGVRLLGPGEGDQACGEYGPGRMLEPTEIAEALLGSAAGPLAGRHVLMTAGPTREALDPVRYITNHSSGKMGYAIARAATAAGARVTLVSGPTTLAPPPGVARVDVESAEQMLAAVLAHADDADVFIGAAAVADYRPLARHTSKMKKSGDGMVLELAQNPDIIATVTAREPTLITRSAGRLVSPAAPKTIAEAGATATPASRYDRGQPRGHRGARLQRRPERAQRLLAGRRTRVRVDVQGAARRRAGRADRGETGCGRSA